MVSSFISRITPVCSLLPTQPHLFALLTRVLLLPNSGVIVNPKGEMKGSAIAGPVAKECVRLLSFPLSPGLLG